MGTQHWSSSAMTLTRMSLHCGNVTMVRRMVSQLGTLMCVCLLVTVSSAGKDRVTLSVSSGGTNR